MRPASRILVALTVGLVLVQPGFSQAQPSGQESSSVLEGPLPREELGSTPSRNSQLRSFAVRLEHVHDVRVGSSLALVGGVALLGVGTYLLIEALAPCGTGGDAMACALAGFTAIPSELAIALGIVLSAGGLVGLVQASHDETVIRERMRLVLRASGDRVMLEAVLM